MAAQPCTLSIKYDGPETLHEGSPIAVVRKAGKRKTCCWEAVGYENSKRAKQDDVKYVVLAGTLFPQQPDRVQHVAVHTSGIVDVNNSKMAATNHFIGDLAEPTLFNNQTVKIGTFIDKQRIYLNPVEKEEYYDAMEIEGSTKPLSKMTNIFDHISEDQLKQFTLIRVSKPSFGGLLGEELDVLPLNEMDLSFSVKDDVALLNHLNPEQIAVICSALSMNSEGASREDLIKALMNDLGKVFFFACPYDITKKQLYILNDDTLRDQAIEAFKLDFWTIAQNALNKVTIDNKEDQKLWTKFSDYIIGLKPIDIQENASRLNLLLSQIAEARDSSNKINWPVIPFQSVGGGGALGAPSIPSIKELIVELLNEGEEEEDEDYVLLAAKPSETIFKDQKDQPPKKDLASTETETVEKVQKKPMLVSSDETKPDLSKKPMLVSSDETKPDLSKKTTKKTKSVRKLKSSD